jgi:chromosome segregation ATPase
MTSLMQTLLVAILGGCCVKLFEFAWAAWEKRKGGSASVRAAKIAAEAKLRIAERDDLADWRRELKAEVDQLKLELKTCREKHDETRLELERAKAVHENMKADFARLEREVTELRSKSLGAQLADKGIKLTEDRQ